MYSSIVLQHARNPRNRGVLEGATHQGSAEYRRCGDRFQLELRLENELIVQAGFQAHACAPVVAMGSIGTQILKGLTVEQALQLLPTQLDRELGGLAPAKRHAILVFLEALYEALNLNSIIESKKEG